MTRKPTYKNLEQRIIELEKEVHECKGKNINQALMLDIKEQNVTQGKRSEEARIVERAYFEKLFESAPEGIALTANDGTVLNVNREFTKIFGYKLDEVLGHSIDILIASKDFFDEATSLTNRTANGNVLSIETIRKKKDGTPVNVSIIGSPISVDNKQIAVYAIYRDITERKKAEEEKNKLEEQLVQVQKMEAIGTLAGGIAHDFNNILGIIMGYTELAMVKTQENNIVQEHLKKAMFGAERAKDMISQILAFSRKDDKTRNPVFLNNIVKEALKLLRHSIPSTIEIRLKMDKKLNPVFANSSQINQIIMNLCTNAAFAMREKGGVLEITLKDINLKLDTVKLKDLEPGKYQQLSIRDTGCGMTKERMGRIFEPYFTTKRHGEGTGMGLSVVHGIVKSHGGEITVYSEPGIGSIFHVYLPFIKELKPIDTKPDRVEPIRGGSERILIVDDEKELAELGKQMLESFGYNVSVRTSSIEALEYFRKMPDKLDLLVTDMTMPNITGLRLAREIKKIRADIPVILCTGFSESIDEENYRSQGINGFVIKPIMKNKIARIVREVLDQKKNSK